MECPNHYMAHTLDFKTVQTKAQSVITHEVPPRQLRLREPQSRCAAFWIRARAMRAAVASPRVRVSAHSHTRNTVHPIARSSRETLLSRAALRASFVDQKVTRVFGVRRCLGHPCQKQPSTKTATFCARNTKSGFPGNGTPRRQPVMLDARRRRIIRSSVERFPCPFTAAMIALRFARDTVSIVYGKSCAL